MQNKVILIIDDQDDLRFILIFDLKKEGFKVIQAKNGEEGIESARLNRPDLILLDRKMQGIDGVETCRRLKADEATKSIPVLMLSGKAQKDELEEALREGASGYIVKPFKFEELLKKISETI